MKNFVTPYMHDAGLRAAPSRPSISIGAEGQLRLNYTPVDPTFIYNAMENERVRQPVPALYERGTLEYGDTQRLQWLAESGRRMVQLGKNWSVAPLPNDPNFLHPASWYPSMREAIDAERRK